MQGFGRSDWIRTSDLLVPNETRYQAALRSEWRAFYRKMFTPQELGGSFFLPPCIGSGTEAEIANRAGLKVLERYEPDLC